MYVAHQLGHGAGLTTNTYGQVIDELRYQPRISAEQAILAARPGRNARRKYEPASGATPKR
jgi:hypothetical protein